MARFAVLVVALMVVAVAVAQNSYTLDIFDVAMDGVATKTAGPVSAYQCTPSSASTTGLAGGIRKLQVSSPGGGTGNIVGSTISMTVFIPSGSTTAPSGVSSGNNNVQNSPTYVALYRIDGQTSLCASGQNTQIASAMTRTTNNLNINLQTIGANAFAFRALGDVTTTTVTVTLYNPSGTALATSQPIAVANSGQTPTFTVYTLNFSDSSKWQTGSSFTGTVGAIELTWNLPQNLQFAVNLVEFLVTATTNVGATVFIDCGCNGFVQGSGDSLQANVLVTLTFGGGCNNAAQTQTTSSTGTVSFTGIPGGCTYTLSISNSGLCPTSSATQTVAAGGSVNFALQGTVGTFSPPPTFTANCGTDTSPATTGQPTSGTGQCGGSGTGSFTFTDVVTPVKCTAPGGIVSTITRTFSQTGSTSVTQTINVVDTKAITLVGVPSSTTLNCNQAVPTVTVTGVACTPVTVVPTQTTQAGTCNTATCSTTGGTTTVTYTGTDTCGNTVSRQTVYTQTGCTVTCPPPPPPSVPPPPTAVPPPPTQLPTNANCRFICDDDDSSAVQVMFSVAMLLLAAVAAF